MDVKSGIYAYLISKPLLTALISERLYPAVATQGAALPYVTYEIEDGNHERHLSGASALADFYFTFTIHSSTSESRDEISEALRNILHTRRNTALTGSIDMRSAALEGRRDSYDDPVNADETGVFVCEMDFVIKIFETLPTLP